MDFYQILGVSRNAADSEIKAAFRKIALKYHPDRHSGASPETKAELAQKFKAATEAYDTLINSSKRSKYNSKSQTAYSAPHRTYNPHAYNYQGYRTHAPRRDSPFRFFSGFARGMTQTDALFHAGMASLLVFGAIAAGGAGDYLWGRWNSGRLFEHIDTDRQQRRKRNQENVRPSPAGVAHMTSKPTSVSDESLEGRADFHSSKTAELSTSKDHSFMHAASQASISDASISAAAESRNDVHSVSSNAAPHGAKQDECNTNGLLTPNARETKHQQSGSTSGTVISADDIDCDSVATH